MQDLGTLGGDSSGATGFNARGDVVGSSDTATGETHAFRWTREGGMHDLGTLGGDLSGAAGINARGQVVGTSTTVSGEEHATMWTP